MADPIQNSINTQSTNKQDKKTAADWVRQLRFNSEVNRSTLGVDTDRVTPQLLLGASSKLLKISRGQAEGDPKDSLQYQRFYGPVEYFAERIQKDGGSIARSLLWKATQKGNVDFIGTGVLQPHVNAVFNGSGISQYVDNSTPMDGVDNSMKVTRVGQGGVSSEDSVPIEMRLVQPSYMGYIDLVRTAEKSPGVTGYVTKNIMKGTDGKLYRNFYNPRTKQMELVDSQKAAASVVTTAQFKDSTDPYVFAVGGSRGVRPIAREKVDYIMPYADQMFSLSANAVPMMSGVKGLRLLMGCLHPDTSVAFVDDAGYTNIVPAKRLGYSKSYLMGCNKDGQDKLVPLRYVVPRFPDKTRKFRRVILESGRVLLTSPDHKWSIYQNQEFKLIKAQDLEQGMIVPRSLFLSMPVRLSQILGVCITEQICILMGRLLRSLQYSSKVYRFNYPKQIQSSLLKALQQLNVIDYARYCANGINYISIKDQRFLDYLDQEVGLIASKRRVPKALLSLPEGFTALLLDSYTKTQDNVGQDSFGDIWLLDIPSAILRDGLSFMFNKIYTDTTYHDAMQDGQIKRALKLKPVEPTKKDIVLDPIRAIYQQDNPAMMIDLDCDDNVYACANGIITHNSKYTNQAIPLQQREASYVQSLDEATGKTMQEIIGKKLGTVWAPKSGTVTAVRQDRIDMLYDDGTKGSVSLYNYYPANAKGFLHSYPKVKAGQKVGADQLLASSNYTDDKGVAALGRNLRVAYMSYKGGTYEDGCTISQSAAKKLGYTTMYKTDMDIDRTIRNSKSLYNTWKPGQFNKQQLQKLDDSGIVKPGTILKKGDPMILGIQTSQPSPGTMGKRLLTDVSKTWQHQHQGVVTDVARTKNGIRIFATVSSPFQLGDKLTGMHGSKGQVSKILPDDQMPRDEKGRPIQILFDPLGIVSRTNPAQLSQAALGKVAQKLGHRIVVPQFMPKGQSRLQWTKQMMKKHNVPWKQTVTDPQTGRKISNVFVGVNYFLPLKHMAQSKMSARGTQQYSAQGIPGGKGMSGSKRLGGLQNAAVIGHNAFDFLVTDAKLIRGQANSDFWRSIRTGTIPTIPGQPLVHKKFFAHLQGAGVNVRKTTKGISIFALSNKDVQQLAGHRELKTRDTYQQKNFRPIDGGLFGKDIFGQNGNQWGYIQLDEPLPNPVMQESLARVLDIPEKVFKGIITGSIQYKGLKNSKDIVQALKKIDVAKQSFSALQQLRTAKNSAKDNALKKYIALAQIRDSGNRPQDYMLDKIPVLPPQLRPVSSHGGLTMVADSNYLYAQLLDARNDFRDAQGLPQQYQKDARKKLYQSWQQLVGLSDPQNAKLKSKNVGGLLKWALGLGRSPKESAFARKIYGSTVDTVGRGVVIPDSRLKLNQIGMPQQMMWHVYAPFATRKLVQAGYTPVAAMQQIKDKSPTAKQYLMQAVQERPVVMNRAPSLHKLSIMGFNVVPVAGHAIKVNPSIVVPFNMDFDGDTVNLHVPVSKGAIRDIRQKMMPQRNLISMRDHKILYKPQKAFLQGLYVATRMGQTSDVKTFNNIAQAKQAYRKGLIDIDTPVIIKRS